MKYFIFNYKSDLHLIDSYLDSSAKAHKRDAKSAEWFLWKFRDNPYGESILACLEDKNRMVGCVGFGIQPFLNEGKIINCALSFETYVDNEYQGQGVFLKLLNHAIDECKNRGIQLLINFPNKNSLPGFIKNNWTKLEVSQYWLKGKNILFIPFYIKHIKKGFSLTKTNFESIKNEFPISYHQNIISENLTSIITEDYIKWRFFTFPNAEYAIINDENFFSIARIGYRGRLKEAQVLFVNPKILESFSIRRLLKEYYKKTKYDLISFHISKSYPLQKSLFKNLAIKVPSKINVCYKILDNKLNIDIESLSLSAINFHTY